METHKIRKAFLEFFAERGHRVVASSSLVPANDPTLLFTNAGMVQFKDVFLGRDRRDYSRATSSQRCVRAGGKHNDLENVGYTARHHTFFEMLGNFSFGDYFKREAIGYAWDLLTQVFNLPEERLWATVYATDEEAYEVFSADVGLPDERIVRIGDKPGGQPYESDNFWQMADTGPCGPCAEIFYDHGPEIEGGPPGSAEEDGDRYIEIWNLVFMQYDRGPTGEMAPLPAPCVDTGMGLERIAAVLQGVHSNYEIDLFRRLIAASAEVTETRDLRSNSLKVIADHIRAAAFLIADGVVPSNEGRGYVLRRIMRRAIRHGYKLGQADPFFYRLMPALDAEMGEAYPEIREKRDGIERTIYQEENRFAETLGHGMQILEETMVDLPGHIIPGEVAFKLYDTYGFPVDLTADIARERDLTVDMAGFEHAMEQQRRRARAASRFEADYTPQISVDETTRFSGYERLDETTTVTALFRDRDSVDRLSEGEDGIVVLDSTPFYGESGGQVGDSGLLLGDGDRRFTVTDTQKRGETYLHVGRMGKGSIRVGDRVRAQVDSRRRAAIVLNHSATHLLHAALRELLGEHVTQKGSLVAPDRLRFDFSHPRPMSGDELRAVEDRVNAVIRQNLPGRVREMPYDTAISSGAMALFGEKYGDTVRVMQFGAFSTELCGGTHVSRTGDIGLFKIIGESGVAAGIRRLEALTGQGALAWVQAQQERLAKMASLVKTDVPGLESRARQLVQRNRELEQELEQLRKRLVSGGGRDLASQAEEVEGHKLVVARLDGADARALRAAVDELKSRLESAVIVLGAVEDSKVRLIAGVTQAVTQQIQADQLVNIAAQEVGGKGGGRADLAQAGGTRPEALDEALEKARAWAHDRLAAKSSVH